jgi:hypothetical protein
MPMAHGHGCGRGHGGGSGAPFGAREEPTLGEGAPQQLGGEAPLPPPQPQLAEVMDCETCLLETLAQGMLHRHGGPPNDFQRKLEGFLKLRPPTFVPPMMTPSPLRTGFVR